MIAECLTYVFKNALGIFLVLFILNKLIGYEIRIKKVLLPVFSAVFLALSVVPFFIMDNIDDARDIVDLSTLLIFIVTPYLVLKPKKKIAFFLFGFIANSVFDLIASIIYLAFNSDSGIILNLIYIALFLICLLITSFVCRKKDFIIPLDFFEQIPIIFYIVIIIAGLSAYYTMMLPENTNYNKNASIALFVISSILVMACVTYIVFKYLTVSSQQKESLAQLDLQVKHYEELAEKNQDIRRFRHDFKNNMFALGILLSEGKFEEAQEYISDMNVKIKETENKFSTGNHLADAIISAKAQEAKSTGIDITFDGNIPSDKIDNSDLCIILSNAVDNAVRACADISPCTISICSAYKSNGCTITVTNPVTQRVEIKNNTVKTSKKDAVNHGFGIGNIKRVAEKYHGYVKLDCTDSLFSIKIGLIL